jgi:hypothetical protein
MTGVFMDAHATVTVERLDQYPVAVIGMIWRKDVLDRDVQAAFVRINQYLNELPAPVYVLVDIRCSPHFPLITTIKGALSGPFTHPHLLAWLIVGKNSMAQVIEHTLSTFTGRHNVLWFTDMASVSDYLIRAAAFAREETV